jgi:hypothetical protein
MKDRGQALVIPALSLSITWLIVKLAGVCEGGNSANDWTILGDVCLGGDRYEG